MTETLQSDWALEMAKSVAVEMIKSTDTAGGKGTQRPPPSSPSPPGKIVSVDAEALSKSDDTSNGSGAPDNGLGGEVDQLDYVEGDGELGIVGIEGSESVRELEGAMSSTGAEEDRS